MWFDVWGAEGAGTLEFRAVLHDEDRHGLNYTPSDLERDVVEALCVLHWEHGAKPVTQAMLEAFNAWRMEKHEAAIATMDAQPERYGLAADDPVRDPPALAWAGGRYELGVGWVITATASATDRATARGRADYEADTRRRPKDEKGEPRKPWGRLSEAERQRWRERHIDAKRAA